MELVKRDIDVPTKHSFFLFGPRLVGKSTLIKHCFSDKQVMVYNLLNYDLIQKLTRDPSSLREEINSRNYKKFTHVVIDEVQKLPWILDEIHYIIEETKHPPFFILTGSSARKLKKMGSNMLAGRAIQKFLFPLTFAELSSTDNNIFSLAKVLEIGSLPSVYLNESKDIRKQILKTYVSTYLKEEIKEESLVRNLAGFSDFLLFASEENGNIINYSNIAQDIGLSSNSIKEYYQILEDTLIGFKLQPLKKSIRQRIAKSPKFYFFDTGVQRALSEKLSVPVIKGTKEFGRTFEHWIIKEIIYMSSYRENDYRFSFYRTEHGVEVDLIIETPKKELIAIEIKTSASLKDSDFNGLKSFSNHFPNAKLFCISLYSKYKTIHNGITILSYEEMFKILNLL